MHESWKYFSSAPDRGDDPGGARLLTGAILHIGGNGTRPPRIAAAAAH
jgi:hypothetical protein